MPFINIEQKEDSVAKLAQVAGKPTKHYLFAPEFNEVINKINLLRHMVVVAGSSIEQILATGVEVALGTIEGDLFEFVNEGETEYALGTLGTTFLTFTIESVYYVAAFVGAPGTYGGSGQDLLMSHLLPVYDSTQSVTTGVASKLYISKIFSGGNTPEIATIGLTYSNPFVGAYMFESPLIVPGKVFVTAVLISNTNIGDDYKVVVHIKPETIVVYHLLNGVLAPVQVTPDTFIHLKVEIYG